jgi:hypothetical protein
VQRFGRLAANPDEHPKERCRNEKNLGVMTEVVISGAEHDLTKTEADAAYCNKYGQESRAAPRGETAREPRSSGMKHILPEPACRKDNEHDKIKAAQSKQFWQQTV